MVDNDGNPPLVGALYFDTVVNRMKVYTTAGTWIYTASGTSNRESYVATAGQTTFAITYTVGDVDVYLNGLKLQPVVDYTATNGTSIVLTTAATSGDVVDIVADVGGGSGGGSGGVPTGGTTGQILAKSSNTDYDTEWINNEGGGGSGLTYWVDGQDTNEPNDTVPVSSLTPVGDAANIDAVLQPKGSGALLAQVPDGTVAGGNKRGAYAVDLQMGRGYAEEVASGDFSVLIGGEANTASAETSAVVGGIYNQATGVLASVVGGSSQTATGYSSAVVGGGGNTASGANSAVIGGAYNAVSGSYSAIICSDESTVTGPNSFLAGGVENHVEGHRAAIVAGSSNIIGEDANSSFIGGGTYNYITGIMSAIIGGEYCEADGSYSLLGGYRTSDRGVASTVAHGAALFSGDFAVTSDFAAKTQTSTFKIAAATNGATPAVMTGSNVFGASPVEITFLNDSTNLFEAHVVARRFDATGENAAFILKGCVKRDNGESTTALVGSVEKTILTRPNSNWDVSITANTTTGGITITVTGEADKQIWWSAAVHTTEMVVIED